LRILHIAPTAFGHDGLFGGGERYPVELARALARIDGVRCEVVTFGRASGVADVDGVRVRVLRPWAHLHGHPAHPLAPALVRALGGADVVHTHHLRSAPSRIAALVARAGRTPLAVTDHGLGGGDWWGVLPRLFDRFLTVSRYSADVLGAPPERTTVVYGGADPVRFAPGPGALTRDGVLFVGRLTPHKGVDRLIAALPDGARLTVVGTGGHDRDAPERDYPPHLRRLAAGKDVRFLDAVPDSDLPALYRSAVVLAVPSVHRTCYGKEVAVSELLGLSTIEAMASGTPVVASHLGGLPEVVADGETGHLVAPGDVGELGDRLAALLADPSHARRLGDAARDRAVERFTWDACAERCLAAYGVIGAR
jgi:glycosyltransferase involved in cell wall biosynthesis